jgi:Zn-dependent M28 family amino/carboxypeptidase
MGSVQVANALVKHVSFLCKDCYPRSFENPTNKKKAFDYIVQYLEESGLKPQIQKYTLSRLGSKHFGRNVIVEFGEKTKPAILLGGHYDSCGRTPGADDNASGVAILLELAKDLRRWCSFPQRVLILFFDNEEPPCFGTKNMGSYRHAQLMRDSNENLEYMIALEMVGYFTGPGILPNGPLGMLASRFPAKADFLALLSKNKKMGEEISTSLTKNGSVPVLAVNDPMVIQSGFGMSDNSSYDKLGFQSFMLTDGAFARNPNYHRESDTPDTLDYARMSEIVRQLSMLSREKPVTIIS